MTRESAKENNPYVMAIVQLEKAAKILNLEENIIERLRKPDRVLEVAIPVHMDNGSLRVFVGFRSQHNNALGPYKGGVRFHPNVTMDEVKALSIWMTWKCSLLALPYGGSKGGVIVDPHLLSRRELEGVSRGYFRMISPIIGPDIDIPAPDVYTDAQTMAWFMDEYYQIVGHNAFGVVTGKPPMIGGSLGRETATARGLAFVVEKMAEDYGFDLRKCTAAIQGYGKVGSYIHKFLQQLGVHVVAASDSKGGIHAKKGLTYEELSSLKRESGTLVEAPSVERISNEELLEIEVDILIPAALENQITSENAGRIKARFVVEGANGPTTPEADDVLRKNGILVVPDVLANAGGVAVSYFEWVQNLSGFYWTENEIDQRLRGMMFDSFSRVKATAKKLDVDMRMAAYANAIERVAQAMKARGWV